MNIRVGFGFDVHRLVPGRRLILCGVAFESPVGLLGHSDADAPVHALCDALLGALALGDIGHLFPDSSEEFAGIDSRILLSRVMALVRSCGWELGNCDLTIALQAPKIAPYIGRMRSSLASVMETDPERVSVKATTTEKLGFVGRAEGCEVWASVLISRE